MSDFLLKLADLLDTLGSAQATAPATSQPTAKTGAVAVAGPSTEEITKAFAQLSPEALTKIAEDAELSQVLEQWLPKANPQPMGAAVKYASTARPPTDAERLEAASRHFEDVVLAATNT